MSIVDQAFALLARGAVTDARRTLEAAAAAGDVTALAQLANWLLVGTHVPRDVPAARALLRRAVAIGHVDAALMEIAFTANGSGGTSDWAAALNLLKSAAPGDPVAAAQLALVQAMHLTETGAPADAPVFDTLSTAPGIRYFPGLFTGPECAHVAQAASDLIEPSMVVDPHTGRTRPDPIRTSDGAVIGPSREDLVIRALNIRIAAASGTDIAEGEPLAVLRYAPGQQYRPHYDTLPGAANQRRWTMLVYLNEGYRGGETRFNALGLIVRGRRGDGLLFCNLDDAGRPNPLARHAGLPVLAGTKWLSTRWIRQYPYDPWNTAS